MMNPNIRRLWGQSSIIGVRVKNSIFLENYLVICDKNYKIAHTL